MIAKRERGELAEQLIAKTCEAEGIEPGTLILHSDRGSVMRSQPVSALLKKLEDAKSFSRPYIPTDNPYSEAHFKTLKFRPDYPGHFEGIEQARDWMRTFIHWHNHEHYHSGLALLTPATVHNSEVEAMLNQRQHVLEPTRSTPNASYGAGPRWPATEGGVDQSTGERTYRASFRGPASGKRSGARRAGRGRRHEHFPT